MISSPETAEPARESFPFCAMIGQERLKQALRLVAVCPRIPGLLVRGPRGTGKSTLIRSLATVLPNRAVVSGCPFRCGREQPCSCPACSSGDSPEEQVPAQMLTLPLGATEEMLVGGVDLGRLLTAGLRAFDQGVLGRANGGYLYIDEVNLMPGHLLDCLLDACETGTCQVEREGMSVSYPARFTLLASMNPEEGDLRPQILDRFGLCVEVEAVTRLEARAEIMRRSAAARERPREFLLRWQRETWRERRRIEEAQQLLPAVHVRGPVLKAICAACAARQVAGNRAEIVWLLATRAAAAYAGRAEATLEDATGVAGLVLLHRGYESDQAAEVEQSTAGGCHPLPCRPAAYEAGRTSKEEPTGEQTSPRPVFLKQDRGENAAAGGRGSDTSGDPRGRDHVVAGTPAEDVPAEAAPAPIEVSAIPYLRFGRDRRTRQRSGRGSPSKTGRPRGRAVGSRPAPPYRDVAFDATLRAAAPYQKRRRRQRPLVGAGGMVIIEPGDLRRRVREAPRSELLVFVVDASGSMGQQLMGLAKGVILRLLTRAYQRRDRVAMVAFAGRHARTILPPTSSVMRAKRHLEVMPAGGRTPLSAGLLEAWKVARSSLASDPDTRPVIILISDGKANVSLDSSRDSHEGNVGAVADEVDHMAELIRHDASIESLVFDTQSRPYLPSEGMRRIARSMGASYVRLASRDAEFLVGEIDRQAGSIK